MKSGEGTESSCVSYPGCITNDPTHRGGEQEAIALNVSERQESGSSLAGRCLLGLPWRWQCVTGHTVPRPAGVGGPGAGEREEGSEAASSSKPLSEAPASTRRRVLFTTPPLASCRCRNNRPQTWWLYICSLQVLEARSLQGSQWAAPRHTGLRSLRKPSGSPFSCLSSFKAARVPGLTSSNV